MLYLSLTPLGSNVALTLSIRVSIAVGEHVPIADFDDPNLDKDAVFYGQSHEPTSASLELMFYHQRMTRHIPRFGRL